MIGARINGGNTGYKRSDADFYPTPPEATQALIDFLQARGLLLPAHRVWECACGTGEMADVFRKNGQQTVATDIRETGYQDAVLDFLDADASVPAEWIITNPPFCLAEDFIKKAVESAPRVAMLLKSQYWHSKKRQPLFESSRPAFVLPLTWRPDFCFKQRGSGSPLMDVIWTVWLEEKGACEYHPLGKERSLF